MSVAKIDELLSANSYPGRGIIIGRQPKSNTAVIAYFIMGRSENSRNRIFEANDRGGIRTKAFDESKLSDPSLIIYNPVLTFEDVQIVTNGDQTDTIYDYMAAGHCYKKALMTRKYEPDEPILTPRISGVLKPNGDYMLSILKSNGVSRQCLRAFYEYESTAGLGHFIHTYKCNSDVPPSFEGEPVSIEIDCSYDEIDAWTEMLWQSLNYDNKVALFTRFVDLELHSYESRIINKNEI
ncbi:MAG: IMP cyclohydrolase [Clostridiales bacterium]|nr:IMP cyclohydrolase [Clostridiales bacterium]